MAGDKEDEVLKALRTEYRWHVQQANGKHLTAQWRSGGADRSMAIPSEAAFIRLVKELSLEQVRITYAE